MATLTGWFALAFIALAALVPLTYRIRAKRRAAPGSTAIRAHVALGAATSIAAFVHTVSMLGDLGAPGAVSGGALSFAPGALAFFVLMAHSGVGLQLRRHDLRDRPKKRRFHGITAVTIALAVTVHVVMLRAR